MVMERVDWSELPKELLLSISKCLDTTIDVLRFRSVCASWHSSVPLHRSKSFPNLPLHLPVWVSPNDHGNRDLPGYFNLTESTIYRLEPVNESSDSLVNQEGPASNMGWLVKLQEETPGKMLILPLLSYFKRCSLHERFKLQKVLINLSKFRISVITRTYNLEYKQPKDVTLYFYGDYYSLEADKVVVSSNPTGDYAIMAIDSGGKLGLLKAGDEKWTIRNDMWTRYEDIISYNGGFYAVDEEGKAMAFDLSLKPSQIAQALPGRGGHEKHLVEMKSTRDLLLVDGYLKDAWDGDFSTITVQFKVYKLNKEMQRWDELKSLGDEALFVGRDCSFSISTKDFPEIKRNCVFYRDQYFGRCNENADALKGFLCHDTGVFDLEDQSVRPLALYPGLCRLFWPPPNLGN